MIFFKNRYRIESIRLKNWDYHSSAYYFVTICTRNRECFFGNVIETEMKLSSIGNIASRYWQEIPNHFPHVQLDESGVPPGVVDHRDHVADDPAGGPPGEAPLQRKPSK